MVLRGVVSAGLRGLSTAQVRRVRPVRHGAADGRVARVYRELERDFGVLAPPVALHSPAPDVLAAVWLVLRETLLVPGRAPRVVKEAVSTAVSEANRCPFCVTMHSSVLDDLVVRGNPGGAAWTAAAEWAGAAAFAGSTAPAPFPAEQAPEVLGTAVVLHHLNRMVNLFLGALPLPPGAPAASMVVVRRVLVRLIQAAGRSGPVRGASLDLLPEADLPADLAWAGADPVLGQAFARAAGALDAAGRRSVPVGARELVLERLAGWDGRAPGVSRAWAEEAVAGLPAPERAAGRLALLTALAAYQVDDAAVAAFREVDREDRALVELTAWASMAAARRIGSWAPLP
ncbi:carboxymuconolactone decarboxylase family protein [Actinosynnema pretiosum subsp. pretiosum]|uniref:Carboxymuconolactone decarboxylase family protein n=1 Tax=Actinosynnema pretiosum subsp. pretiosum TaxID=103721 RepID=A0AA45L710_9PSEU|nr:carboxymuconolactone decarboxylase family protein [Actinosynnema pretiosum subsp. pretiosum]